MPRADSHLTPNLDGDCRLRSDGNGHHGPQPGWPHLMVLSLSYFSANAFFPLRMCLCTSVAGSGLFTLSFPVHIKCWGVQILPCPERKLRCHVALMTAERSASGPLSPAAGLTHAQAITSHFLKCSCFLDLGHLSGCCHLHPWGSCLLGQTEA